MHSKTQAAGCSLAASAFHTFMWDCVSPNWQSSADPAGKHSVNSSRLPSCQKPTHCFSTHAIRKAASSSSSAQCPVIEVESAAVQMLAQDAQGKVDKNHVCRAVVNQKALARV